MDLLNLAHNVGLIVSLVVLHRMVIRDRVRGHLARALTGALYGGVAVLGMAAPIRFADGVIFDPRSIVLVIGGMFGGPVVAAIAAAMCVAYRMHIGGSGAYAGVSATLWSAAVGLAAYYLRHREPRFARPLGLLTVGFVTHAGMLAIMLLLLPRSATGIAFVELGAVILLLYPLATVAVGTIVIDGEARIAEQEALVRSEARYRTLFTEMAQGVVYQNAEGAIYEANPAAERILGLTRDELVGRTSRDPRWQAVREDGEPFAAEEHPSMVALHSGHEVRDVLMGVCDPRREERRWIAVSAVPLFGSGSDRPNEVFSSFADLTDLKRAEEDYRTLFQSMLEGFVVQEVVRGADGAVVDYRYFAANPAFERIVGVPASQLVGRTAREAFPDEPPLWLAQYAAVAETGEPLQFAGKAGPLATSCEVTAFRAAPERVASVVADVTAREQAEAERAALQEQLQQSQRLQGLGVLAGGIAHDFNNILVEILGSSEMALDEVPPGSLSARRLGRIRTAATRASDLVRQILAFGRRASMQRVPVDLSGLVRESIRFMRATLPASIVIEEQIDEAPCPVLADKTLIHQVLVNLCANAAHAMRETGGTVTVRVTHDDPAPPGQVCVEVSDTGEGMDAETLARAFEPFFTTKAIGEGTGLGLAVCHGILASHEGGIEAESTPGAGTTVRFHLPSTDEPVAAASAAPVHVAPSSAVILIVDDEAGVREVGVALVSALGYAPVSAASVEEALAILRAPRDPAIALVLTDLTMPGLGGIDLAREVRQLDRELPIVITTGDGRAVTPEIAAELGVAGVLLKPYTRAELAAVLARALGQAAPAQRKAGPG